MTYYVKVYLTIIALSFYISFSVCMLTESLHELLHESYYTSYILLHILSPALKMTQLHEASSIGDLVSLEEGLKAGLDPSEPDNHWGDRAPLHVACASGHKKIVYLLLQSGANPNSLTNTGWTPAHFACEGGKEMHNVLLCTYINS